MFHQHTTRRHVKSAVKVTRKALNRALDAAEPKLASAAGELEDLSRDAYAALRKTSLERIDDLKHGYDKIERRARKQLPKLVKGRKMNPGKVALVCAGVTALAVGLLKR